MEYLEENDKIAIRKLAEEDYDAFCDLNYSRSLFKAFFNEKFMQRLWKSANAEDILVCTIIEKSSGDICGFCQLEHIDTQTQEIGIDIIDRFMMNGYGQGAVKLLMSYAKQCLNADYFIWKAYKTNSISIHIAKKLGGQFISEKTLLPQKMIGYGKEKGIITSDEDISYVCIYKIE